MNKRLLEMLSYKRPYNSTTEVNWIDRFIMPYGPEVLGEKDDPMVYLVTVKNPDGSEPNILFSGHTDTMHHKPGRQKLVVDKIKGLISKNDGEPLGADDAAGVWLLLEMIDAEVPGVYSFPRGEERGGIGSSWFAKNCSTWLQRFDYAVAFDRKATDSIITHQGCGMCCSNTFAEALGNALNEHGDYFMYSPDDTGIYTDTAEYVDLIAECTNVSVGYYSEHTENERLDVNHLTALRDACVKVNWSALPVVRRPGEDDFRSRYPTRGPVTTSVLDLTRDEMLWAIERDPDGFVDLLREELDLPEDDWYDYTGNSKPMNISKR